MGFRGCQSAGGRQTLTISLSFGRAYARILTRRSKRSTLCLAGVQADNHRSRIGRGEMEASFSYNAAYFFPVVNPHICFWGTALFALPAVSPLTPPLLAL